MNHKEECECVFCQLHCQECGSTDLDVEFKPVFQFTNDTWNKLNVYHDRWEIRVECQEYGEVFEHNDFEENWDIEELADGIGNVMGIAEMTEISIDKKGKISNKQFTMGEVSSFPIEDAA